MTWRCNEKSLLCSSTNFTLQCYELAFNVLRELSILISLHHWVIKLITLFVVFTCMYFIDKHIAWMVEMVNIGISWALVSSIGYMDLFDFLLLILCILEGQSVSTKSKRKQKKKRVCSFPSFVHIYVSGIDC
jgi:hypothetical protein